MICPHCSGNEFYHCQRPNGRARYRCKSCRKDFTDTSSTARHAAKKPVRHYDEILKLKAEGFNANQISSLLGVDYKCVWGYLKREQLNDKAV